MERSVRSHWARSRENPPPATHARDVYKKVSEWMYLPNQKGRRQELTTRAQVRVSHTPFAELCASLSHAPKAETQQCPDLTSMHFHLSLHTISTHHQSWLSGHISVHLIVPPISQRPLGSKMYYLTRLLTDSAPSPGDRIQSLTEAFVIPIFSTNI